MDDSELNILQEPIIESQMEDYHKMESSAVADKAY